MQTVGTPMMWLLFAILVTAMLAIDLGVFHRSAHEVKFREALAWSGVWIALALVFNGFVYLRYGTETGLQFLTGWLIEKALSVDNLFVMLVVFGVFGVPAAYRHKVLFWGILGALLMRAVFIFAGTALIQRFHWVMYFFGALLIYTAVKLFWEGEEQPHPEENRVFRAFQRLVPATGDYRGANFWVRENGRLLVTPLLLVVVLVELTDLLFAVDSIPAIFAISTDPFIVFTSNIFAILGLRALFFVLAGVMGKFEYLKVGLAFVLLFVGAKMIAAELGWKLPIHYSLLVIAGILAVSIGVSLLRAGSREQRDAAKRARAERRAEGARGRQPVSGGEPRHRGA